MPPPWPSTSHFHGRRYRYYYHRSEEANREEGTRGGGRVGGEEEEGDPPCEADGPGQLRAAAAITRPRGRVVVRTPGGGGGMDGGGPSNRASLRAVVLCVCLLHLWRERVL
jgi:hypothetical protein